MSARCSWTASRAFRRSPFGSPDAGIDGAPVRWREEVEDVPGGNTLKPHYPSGRVVLPPGRGALPSKRACLPSGRASFPLRHPDLPPARPLLPLGRAVFTLAGDKLAQRGGTLPLKGGREKLGASIHHTLRWRGTPMLSRFRAWR